jgi:hypothetical protein
VRFHGRGRELGLWLDDIDVVEVDLVRSSDLDLMLFGRRNGRGVARELGRAPPAPNSRCLGGRRRGRHGRGGSSRGGATAAPCGRRRLLFRSDPLLTLPARANSRDLVVRE